MKLFISIILVLFVTSCGGAGNNSTGSTTKDRSWLVDTYFVQDGGPGKDGIPAIDFPLYLSIQDATYINDSELVVGLRINGVTRAYPHSILNWHEIVNIETNGSHHSLIYCPLTGTASLWTIPDSFSNKTFGVSGKLYNSNVIPYDRETDSNWVQMLAQSVNGSLKGQFIDENVVIETTWATWKLMYPDTTILSDVTGFSRGYSTYPYGGYLTNDRLLFDVANDDNRLHKKTRVLGIYSNGVNKVYEINNFSTGVEVLNENSSSSAYVVIGSSEFNFGIAYSSTTLDGTELTFTAVQFSLPTVMIDNEGNQWDILGNAVSGTRAGEKLTLKSDFIAYWFAWVAIHRNSAIHEFL